ncbi:MAG: tape measure protein [Muribaculaceae bacterium]|nr:tape measure protein [Muribaculaceae bacterium]
MAYDGTLLFDTELNTDGFQSGANKLNGIVSGLGAFKLLEKGFQMVTGSVDKAMDRIDTMDQFTRVMTTVTNSASATSAALAETTEIVTGTAYGLDYAAQAVQNFTSRGMEIERSTDTVRRWGDAVAFYGNGSNAAFASVTDALSKMQTKGNVTMEHMEMLLNAGIPAIEMYADAIGVTASDVTTMMSNGELSAASFIATMNNAIAEGTSKFPSLAGAAKEAGASWGATWDNMNAAITRGVQAIILAVDDTQEALGRPTMRDAVKSFGSTFEKSLKAAAAVIPPVIKNLDLLAIGITGVTLAFGADKAIKSFALSTEIANKALLAAEAAGQLVIPTLNAKMVAEARAAAVQRLGNEATEEQIIAEMASAGVISAKTLALGGMTTGLSASTVASMLLTGATTALGTAIKGLMGPVGWAIAGGTLLVGGAMAVYKWITAETAAYEAQSAAVEDLASTQQSLKQSIDSSAKSYAGSIKSMNAGADAAKKLAAQMLELQSKENQSAADKALLASYVEQLNDQMEGLNLVYDEENNLLNLNEEQIRDYIDAKLQLEESNALVERQNELYQEEALLLQNLQELDEKQQELDAQLADKSLKQQEYNDLLEQLNETRAAYIEQEQSIADKKAEIEARIGEIDTASAQTLIDNAEAVAEAQEAELKRRQDALAAYTDAATEMFDRINTQSKVSVEEMIANLQANQETVAAWADNLVELGRRGLDEGLLQQLRDAGPESAATVAELVSATDEQLITLSETFANGGNVAAQALMTELGLPEVVNSGSDMVDSIAVGVNTNPNLTNATIKLISDAKQAGETAVAANRFNTIGTQMMAAITGAVLDGRSGLVAAMVGNINAALEAAKAAADIHSPSRRARKEVGLPISQGVALGVEDGTPQMVSSAEGAMAALWRVLSGGADPGALVGQMKVAAVTSQAIAAGQAQAAGTGLSNAVMPIRSGDTYNTQNIYFEEPMQAPDEIARALRIEQTYGLAGDYDD